MKHPVIRVEASTFVSSERSERNCQTDPFNAILSLLNSPIIENASDIPSANLYFSTQPYSELCYM